MGIAIALAACIDEYENKLRTIFMIDEGHFHAILLIFSSLPSLAQVLFTFALSSLISISQRTTHNPL
jgi:hypothetical protein